MLYKLCTMVGHNLWTFPMQFGGRHSLSNTAFSKVNSSKAVCMQFFCSLVAKLTCLWLKSPVCAAFWRPALEFMLVAPIHGKTSLMSPRAHFRHETNAQGEGKSQSSWWQTLANWPWIRIGRIRIRAVSFYYLFSPKARLLWHSGVTTDVLLSFPK